MIRAIRFVAGSLVVLSVLTFGIVAGADEDIAQMLQSAKTAADHEAIAAYYTREADSAKAKVDLHRKMGEIVKRQGGAGVAKWHMDEHCDELVREFESAAKQYSALAEAHRSWAKELK